MLEKLLKLLKIKFEGELTLKDGTPIILDGELGVGVSIMVQAPDGKTMDLPDGSYDLSTGEVITVENGLVIDVIEELVNKPSPDPGANLPHGHGPSENHPPDYPEHYSLEPKLTPVEDTGDGETITGATVKKETYSMTPEELQKLIEELTARVTALEEKIATLEGGATPSTDTTTTPDATQMAIEKIQKDIETIMSKANFTKEVAKIETEPATISDSRLDILKKYRRT